MVESNSIESISTIIDNQQFRLNKISEIEQLEWKT